MPTETGIWTIDEALAYHDFSYRLAKFIGSYLSKEESLIDFGCGRATYLKYFHDIGFKQLYGVEGTNFPAFEYSNITVQDLTVPFIKDSIGNSLCLEVGEHIDKKYEHIFIDNLVNNTQNKLILSWAKRGQEGIGHVNCQHNIYIIDQLQKKGMKFLVDDSLEIREHVDNHTSYFRDTLMIFQK